MYSTVMPRSGFLLRPLTMKDEAGVEALFSDPDIVKTLAHDTSSPDAVRRIANEWCRTCAIDGPDSHWTERGICLWAITPSESASLIGVRGFEGLSNMPEGNVEAFVVIAKAYWGQGISTESAQLLTNYLFERTTNHSIFTFIWPLLNPGSEAVQRKMGFRPVERVSVRESYGEEMMANVRDFELWRISNAGPPELDPALRQGAIKLGQLSAEGMFSTDEAYQLILNALPNGLETYPGAESIVRDHVASGHENPAWATYRLTSADWIQRSSFSANG